MFRIFILYIRELGVSAKAMRVGSGRQWQELEKRMTVADPRLQKAIW